MPEPMTLTEWLLERLAEDEAKALAAGGGEWRAGTARWRGPWEQDEPLEWRDLDDYVGVSAATHPYEAVVHDDGRPTADEARFIAHNDPARVLAQVAASRAIVAAFVETSRLFVDPMPAALSAELAAREDALELAVRHLASVYAAAPGYREEWKP